MPEFVRRLNLIRKSYKIMLAPVANRKGRINEKQRKNLSFE